MVIVARFKNSNENPIGMIIPSMLTEAQFQALNGTNWVLAAGQNVAGSTYATMTGNSSVPDLRGRVMAGKDDMRGAPAGRLTNAASGVDGLTLGAAGGAETHTMIEAELPIHTHTQNSHNHTQNAHSHSIGYYNSSRNVGSSGAWSFHDSPNATNAEGGWINNTTATNIATTATNQNTGSGSPHQNTQPTLVVNYFIRIEY